MYEKFYIAALNLLSKNIIIWGIIKGVAHDSHYQDVGAELNFVRNEIFLTVDNVHTDFYSLGILAKFT